MCSCRKATHTRQTNGSNDGCRREPNPRLILAVVSIGVIVGALLAPSRQSGKTLVVETNSAPVAANTSR